MSVVDRIVAAYCDPKEPRVSYVELNKILYLVQAAGCGLGLKFFYGVCGPTPEAPFKGEPPDNFDAALSHVVKVVGRQRSPHFLRLLASAHWLETVPGFKEQTLEFTRKTFSEDELDGAVERLRAAGFFSACA